MSSFTETSVEVDIRLVRRADGTSSIMVRGRSLTPEGMVVRTARVDMTDRVGPTRTAAAFDLMDAAVAFFKNHWNIP